MSLRAHLWLIAIVFALHEAEEWHLVDWLRIHFEPDPAFSDRDARTLLVLFALLGLSLTAACLRWLSLRGALFALLPLFVGLFLGNALTHIVWALQLGGYAPGVVTSVLLVPLVGVLVLRVLRERRVSPAFVLPFLVVAVIQPLGAAWAGGTLTGPQLALQRFGARLGAWLWGPL